MKKMAMLLFFGPIFTISYATNRPVTSDFKRGTSEVDERNLKELEKNKAILDRQAKDKKQGQEERNLEKQQNDHYHVPGAQEANDRPIYRQDTGQD